MCAAGATTTNHLAESGPLKNINIQDTVEWRFGKICKRGNRKRRQWCLVPFDVAPWEDIGDKGEKRMGCLYRLNRGDGN